jgi:hypothetical protein
VWYNFDPETRYTFGGIAGRIFSEFGIFWNRSIPSWSLFIGKSAKESQMGLIMNGFLKFQCSFILLIGVMVFCIFQFNDVPLNFNPVNKIAIENSVYR